MTRIKEEDIRTDNKNFYVGAKTCMDIFKKRLKGNIYNCYNRIWKETKEEYKPKRYNKKQTETLLMEFQKKLSNIKNWNEEVITKEFDIIREKSNNCNWENLISTIFVNQTRLLSHMLVGKQKKAIDLRIPSPKNFIHKVFIEAGNRIYENPYLFEDRKEKITSYHMQKNMTEVNIIICCSIEDTINQNLPIDEILDSYIEDNESENESFKAPQYAQPPLPTETPPAPRPVPVAPVPVAPVPVASPRPVPVASPRPVPVASPQSFRSTSPTPSIRTSYTSPTPSIRTNNFHTASYTSPTPSIRTNNFHTASYTSPTHSITSRARPKYENADRIGEISDMVSNTSSASKRSVTISPTLKPRSGGGPSSERTWPKSALKRRSSLSSNSSIDVGSEQSERDRMLSDKSSQGSISQSSITSKEPEEERRKRKDYEAEREKRKKRELETGSRILESEEERRKRKDYEAEREKRKERERRERKEQLERNEQRERSDRERSDRERSDRQRVGPKPMFLEDSDKE